MISQYFTFHGSVGRKKKPNWGEYLRKAERYPESSSTLFRSFRLLPAPSLRCLILAADGLSFMFFAWMVRDGSSGLQ
jgi:hypothetical protein